MKISLMYVATADDGLQNLNLYTALWTYEQEGISIVLHLLWHGASVFPVSSERPSQLVASYGCSEKNRGATCILTQILAGPHSVASNDTQGDTKDLHVF
jgi:hypothetical protein